MFLHADVAPHAHEAALSAPILVGVAVLSAALGAAVVAFIRKA